MQPHDSTADTMSLPNPLSYRDDLITPLSALIADDGPTAFFLEGGHFDPRFDVTPFARRTLRDALEVSGELIKRFGRKVRIVLGVLVDDLGLDCGDDVCSPNSATVSSPSGSLPDALEAILSASHIVKRERVLVSSERNAKNRGIARLKRMLASSESLRQERRLDAERITIDAGRSVLLAEVHGASWSVKCPMVMAQHYLDVAAKLRQRFPAGPRLVLVDWSEMLDRPNVVAGADVAVFMARDDGPFNVFNVLFGDDEGEICRIHHASDSKPGIFKGVS